MVALQSSVGEAPGLTDGEIEHFIEHGFVILRGCFDRAFAEKWKAAAWADLELSPSDPRGWETEADVVHCEPQNSIAVGELAPRAWRAIQQLYVFHQTPVIVFAASPTDLLSGFVCPQLRRSRSGPRAVLVRQVYNQLWHEQERPMAVT